MSRQLINDFERGPLETARSDDALRLSREPRWHHDLCTRLHWSRVPRQRIRIRPAPRKSSRRHRRRAGSTGAHWAPRRVQLGWEGSRRHEWSKGGRRRAEPSYGRRFGPRWPLRASERVGARRMPVALTGHGGRRRRRRDGTRKRPSRLPAFPETNFLRKFIDTNRHAGRHGAPSGQAGAYPLAAS